ncbi:MAG: ESPR-type extended signal peptide-containing protein [Megasphaera massiliensis]|uniref:ESPR-type extended signal peptide-containing protein n=3 Tax=Megasphaera TaxID=906 RepID=UPI002A759D65|nr:ESPR-type extended signal peptide-containing protein [Megasphaera massiliensis]MDY2964606.1 ESPR-type extended signal peptide-containing protein [Megasphaera massiliensis]
MNRIYKLVWNRVRNCYVVTSELAKSYGRNNGNKLGVTGRVVAGALAVLLGSSLSLGTAFAEGVTSGDGAHKYQQGIAIGDNAAAVDSTASNGHSGNTAIAIGANSKASVGNPLSQDVNTGAIAIGTGARADYASIMIGNIDSVPTTTGLSGYALGTTTIGIGQGVKIENSVGNGISIGTGSTSSNSFDSVSLGTGNNISNGNNNVALGAGINIDGLSNVVALGAGSSAEGAVSTAGMTIGSQNYNFAGTNVNGTVSIGNGTTQRTLTHLAAGRVDAGSTDAVNGSQLFAVAQAAAAARTTITGGSHVSVSSNTGAGGSTNYTISVNGTDTIAAGNSDLATSNGVYQYGQTLINNGLKFGANSASGAANPATAKLGSTVNVVGEGAKADTEYSGDNLKTVVSQDGAGNTTITVKMDKNPTFDSITTIGDAHIGGAANIDGNATVGGDTHLKQDLQVDGNTNIDGNTTVGGDTHLKQDLQVDGNTNIDGNTTVGGDIHLKQDLQVDGNTNIDGNAAVGGDTHLKQDLQVDGNTNIDGNAAVGGDTHLKQDLQVDGNTNIDGNTTVGGDTHLKQDLQVDGNTNIGGNTTIAGDTHIQQNLQVDGDANIKGDVHAGVGYFNDIQLPGGSLTGRLDKMDTRINRVGAGAAALSALHPQDFDPDNKWDFATGYGNYKDAHAVAVGAFYRPNEDTMFSVGGSFGGGENMVNAGVTFKLGQKSTVSRSKVSMAKEIIALRNDNLEMRQELDELKNMMKAGTVSPMRNVNFSDVPKDHWAYQYVKSLADRGYLNGYTDGEFKGDRAMTRYEYAAIVYRALQNGAPVDADMGRSLSEFAPEVEKVASADRFRVDRISGKDNDRHKVERVRINDKDDKVQNVFRDVYGDYIQK